MKNASAQVANFDRVVQPVDVKAKDFPEYLVQLAWVNNPANKVLDYKKEAAQAEVKLAKKTWLNSLSPSVGYAHQPLPLTKPRYNTSNPQQPLLVGFDLDRYVYTNQFTPSLGLNLGVLFSTKGKKNIAEQQVKIADADINQQKLTIRAETLARYQNFKLALEILKTRTQVEQDAKNNFDIMAQQFRSDAIKFSEYNEAATTYHEAVESRIKAESDYQIARIHLEEIIGVRWDDVSHPGKDK